MTYKCFPPLSYIKTFIFLSIKNMHNDVHRYVWSKEKNILNLNYKKKKKKQKIEKKHHSCYSDPIKKILFITTL